MGLERTECRAGISCKEVVGKIAANLIVGAEFAAERHEDDTCLHLLDEGSCLQVVDLHHVLGHAVGVDVVLHIDTR